MGNYFHQKWVYKSPNCKEAHDGNLGPVVPILFCSPLYSSGFFVITFPPPSLEKKITFIEHSVPPQIVTLYLL
jgi:hypothetical protein